MRALRVAVVGAGPAGIYAADALTAQDATPTSVDVLERLPTPFGLVRYGVAPDHLKFVEENKPGWKQVRVFDSDVTTA